MWPWFDSDVRYTDPVDAALGFAEGFVGFEDPEVGPFMQGDSRSGEVEIRPRADGPVTVVLVRQLGNDDSWWVLGAITENIVVEQPDALADVGSPVVVSGEALAFEGTVDVLLRRDGEDEPLLEEFVTGGGDVMREFAGEFPFDNPGDGAGALLLFTRNVEDGTIWEATVVRVGFAEAT